jgi:ADP-ribose pyrophosphatase YjhB (NUDIX family)
VKYCSECAAPLGRKRVEPNDRERLVCTRCSKVHFENPKVLVSCLAHCESRLVMCRRAHEPAAGLWAPPGGFVEMGETLEYAAARETEEEVGLLVDPNALIPYAITTLPHINEIYVAFRIEVSQPILKAGPESLEVALFGEQDMPWERIAFAEAPSFFRLFFREERSKQFSLHLSRTDGTYRMRRSFPLLDQPT